MSESASKVLVLGTNDYAAVLMDVFDGFSDIRIVGLIENQDYSKCNQQLFGLPVYWSDETEHLANDHFLTCSIGTTLRKTWIENRNNAGFKFIQLMHNSSVISSRTSFGQGAIVDAGVVIAGFSKVADHVRIGRRASIGHHTTVGNFSTIHPGAIISGNCHLGQQVTIGTGAVIIDGIKVNDGAFIAAGAVVTRDVPDNVLVAGNPAKVIRTDFGPR